MAIASTWGLLGQIIKKKKKKRLAKILSRPNSLSQSQREVTRSVSKSYCYSFLKCLSCRHWATSWPCQAAANQ